MKYLKLFENYIKHSDPIAVEHPLLGFSKRLENIVIELQKLDSNQNTIVRRYFKEDFLISITYTTKYKKVFDILLLLNEDKVRMLLTKYKIPSWMTFDDKNTEEFLNFVNYTLDIQDKYGIIFSLDQKDEIIKKLEEYYTIIDAKKYNL